MCVNRVNRYSHHTIVPGGKNTPCAIIISKELDPFCLWKISHVKAELQADILETPMDAIAYVLKTFFNT